MSTATEFKKECDMIFDVGLKGCIGMLRFFNNDFAQELDYSEKELIGKKVTDFLVDAKP